MPPQPVNEKVLYPGYIETPSPVILWEIAGSH